MQAVVVVLAVVYCLYFFNDRSVSGPFHGTAFVQKHKKQPATYVLLHAVKPMPNCTHND